MPMNEITITPTGKKRDRYVSGLLIMHGINQTELAKKIGVSQPFLSLIITGRRVGAKEKGKRVRRIIAESLGMDEKELWPDKAA